MKIETCQLKQSEARFLLHKKLKAKKLFIHSLFYIYTDFIAARSSFYVNEREKSNYWELINLGCEIKVRTVWIFNFSFSELCGQNWRWRWEKCQKNETLFLLQRDVEKLLNSNLHCSKEEKLIKAKLFES